MMRTWLVLLAVVVAAPLAGCTPVKASFTLFGNDGKLEEKVVYRDKGADGNKVLLIDVRGLIADREGGDLFASGPNPVDEMAAKLAKAEKDPSIKAVIIRINSPGGSVAGSDMMYREVTEFRKRTGKPVVASLGEIAASGGYYLALAGDRILVERATITGSIGVIIPTVNFSDGLNRIGIRSRSVISKPNKDIANPLEPMDAEHYVILQGIVNEFYDNFRGLVIERRSAESLATVRVPAATAVATKPIEMSRIDELTDGRVMTGAMAVQVGLADGIGGITDAFRLAKAFADLKAAELVKYYRQDSDAPRTPYATSGLTGPSGDVNLFQLRVDGLHSPVTGAGAYYLWVAGE